MALLDEVQLFVRTTEDVFDPELVVYVKSALMDMRRAGVREELLDPANLDPMAKYAVMLWCKANYGYDNPESDRFMKSYRDTVCSLLCSSANECDGEEGAFAAISDFNAMVDEALAAMVPADEPSEEPTDPEEPSGTEQP